MSLKTFIGNNVGININNKNISSSIKTNRVRINSNGHYRIRINKNLYFSKNTILKKNNINKINIPSLQILSGIILVSAYSILSVIYILLIFLLLGGFGYFVFLLFTN